MRVYVILFLSLLTLMSSKAQNFKQSDLETTITEATVFIEGAQVTRQGHVNLSSGRTELVIKSLSPHIDEKSIQIKAEGDFTVLSVNHRLNYLEDLYKDDEMYPIQVSIDSLIELMDRNKVRVSVLKEKESLLSTNKNLGGEKGATIAELKDAIEFYDFQLMAIKTELAELKNKYDEFAQLRRKLELQASAIQDREDQPTGEIKVRLEAKTRTKGSFIISYQVAHVGWFPKYDLRVSTIDQPLALRYKADIYQQTGVDWNNVKLRLSSGSPSEGGLAPELQTWHLNYTRNTIYQKYQNGKVQNTISQVTGKVVDDTDRPIPGVNVVVKGTTVGTTTDLDGNYALTLPNGATTLTFSFIGMVSQELPITSSHIFTEMQSDIQELQEVAIRADGYDNIRIRGYNSLKNDADFITTTIIENQTAVYFEVDEPYTIKSNGEKLTVDLTNYEIDATYEYFAAPKLDNDAFLMAYITDWDQYNLLEGEANLYFEDTYVGRSVLEAKTLNDTLSISLGRDKSIVIGRTKIDDFTKVKTIGSNQMESRGYKIQVRNKKKQAIKLTLTDQVPVAAISSISVDIHKLSGATLNKSTGLINWKMNLPPQEQHELEFSYSVKYPKREVVNLE